MNIPRSEVEALQRVSLAILKQHERQMREGRRFGKLQVIRLAEPIYHSRVLVRCDCGQVTSCYITALIEGRHTACGVCRNLKKKGEKKK